MPATRTVPLLPPAEFAQACPALPPRDFRTTADVFADDDKVRALYGPCAAKVAGIAAWREAHGK